VPATVDAAPPGQPITRAIEAPPALRARPLPGVEARVRPSIEVRTPPPLPPIATAPQPARAEARPPETGRPETSRADEPQPAATPAVGAAPALAPRQGPAAARSEPGLAAEARGFIADLTEVEPKPLPIERVDHFVTQDQVLSLLPESAVETLTREELRADRSLDASTPITVVHEVEQVETTTPERLIADAAGNLDAPVRVVEGDAVRTTSVRELLERHAAEPEAVIHVMKRVRTFEITTPGELERDPEIAGDTPLRIIRQRYRLEAATIADLIRAEQAVEPDSVFYVRTVRSSDVQGLWGIVHDGIIGNFARGVAIRRGEEIDTYQVEIPRDADERLRDRSSSFLGKMISDKTRASWVYNFKENRMGRNPDSILPGQEVVIIKFRAQELIAIYRHFARADG
jgi:hypothetical protein